MKTVSAIFVGLFVTTLALADDKAMQKYRNYTPQQLRDLPQKVLSSEVPMAYSFAARRGLAPDSELLFGMELNRLMYPGLHDYKTAVRKFQIDLGDKPTRTLTVWQIHNLELRSDMQQLSPLIFPDQFQSMKLDTVARVTGTLTILDEQIAWPINHAKVTCDKQERQCRMDNITLAVPNANSWSQSYQVMFDTELFDISRWDADSIDATRQAQGACRSQSLNFNFKTKEFFYITRNAGGDCQVLGTTLERLPKPRIAQIVDGNKIIGEQFNKIRKAAYDVLASDFRKAVDKVNAKSQGK
jgi:hypothetical protein